MYLKDKHLADPEFLPDTFCQIYETLLFHFCINLLLNIFFVLIASTNFTRSYLDGLRVISLQLDLKVSQLHFATQRTAAVLSFYTVIKVTIITYCTICVKNQVKLT